MVLFIGEVKLDEIPTDSGQLFHLAPHLQESGRQFAKIIPKKVSPIGLLYVSQREFAISSPHDKNINILGTDDCTTCLAIVLRHSLTGVTAIGHLESVCVEGVSLIIQRLQETSCGYSGFYDEGPFQMHLVGSFSDCRGYSEELIYSLLHYIHKLPVKIELVTACVGVANTGTKSGSVVPWPNIYGVGVNLKTGDIFPATFDEKGPDIPLRGARIFTGSHCLLEVYDCQLGLLRIGPFHYEPMRCANIMLQQSDEFILQHLSSSPEVEPSHVVDSIRSTLKHIQEHPFPEITIFQDNRPRCYRKDENGLWVPVYPRMDSFRFEQLA